MTDSRVLAGARARGDALPHPFRRALSARPDDHDPARVGVAALGDLVRYQAAGREDELLRCDLGENGSAQHARELAKILAAPAEEESILRFADLAPRLYRSFEDRALEELR